MTRMMPFPLASSVLFVVWILLNQSFSLGHILLGGAVALTGGWMLAALTPPKAHPSGLIVSLRLGALVFKDVVRSNIAVASIILGLKQRTGASGFMQIPLELRDPYGLAVLACIITSTPGTLWVDFDETSGTLTIHVLDLVDETDLLRAIKGGYERLLLEIFT